MSLNIYVVLYCWCHSDSASVLLYFTLIYLDFSVAFVIGMIQIASFFSFYIIILIFLKGCKEDELGMKYSGYVNRTVGGLLCQHWGSQTPNTHYYAYLAGEENFCRNPGYFRQPWCYTTSPSTRWDYCDIPVCSKLLVPTEHTLGLL